MGYTTSPLRYPGGKTRLAGFIKQVLALNGLTGGVYAEPYAGGAGIAWSLLFGGLVSRVYINDASKAVHAFWRSVFEDTEALCRRIWDTPVSMEAWRRAREVLANPTAHTLLEVGFSAFFLNRTNRSGIIGGGVIGGKSQAGRWRLDARYNKEALVKRIQRIAQYAGRVTLTNLDASVFIEHVLPDLPIKSLVYLDPPYYKKGCDLYEDRYTHDDHVALARLVSRSIKQSWIVSYDDVPEVRELYAGYSSLAYQLAYSAADRYRGTEVMFFSPGLTVPEVASPLGIKPASSPPAQGFCTQ